MTRVRPSIRGSDEDNEKEGEGAIDDENVGDIDDGDINDRNTAAMQGVLGLDALGNWTVNEIVVAIDPDTELEGGLVLGQTVEVEGVLQEDGTILT